MKKPNLWRCAVCTAAVLLTTSTFGVALQKEEAPRKIEITAKRYSFDPNEITVKKGESVVLAIHSTDVTHGFEVKGLGINAEIPNGRVTEVPLTPAETGDFDGQCNHFCGEDHGSMTFTVHVIE
jgi:cytochrome c oxidase subunit 2